MALNDQYNDFLRAPGVREGMQRFIGNSISFLDNLENYRYDWTTHLHRMNRNSLRKMNDYRPNGKRSTGRPNDRLNEIITGL